VVDINRKHISYTYNTYTYNMITFWYFINQMSVFDRFCKIIGYNKFQIWENELSAKTINTLLMQ
jgi:hypothetical protein